MSLRATIAAQVTGAFQTVDDLKSTITVYEQTSGSYDAATGQVTRTTSQYPVLAVLTQPKRMELEDPMVRTTDTIALVDPADFASPTLAFGVVATASQDAGATATQVTLTEPAEAQPDDLIIVLVKNDSVTATWTPPADFTQIEETAATANQGYWLGYKVRGATQGNGYTFSHDFGGGTNTAGIMLVVRDQNSTPFDVAYLKANHFVESTDDLSYAPAAITTTTADALVLILSGWSGGPGSIAFAPPAGYTTEVSLEAGSSRNLNAVSKAVATAGLETPGQFATTGDAGEDGASFTLAVREAAVPVSGLDPQLGMRVDVGSEEHTIVKVLPVGPTDAGPALLWKLILRRPSAEAS